MRRVRSMLTYSNVVSTLCLFLLLGGGAAYAASHLGKNSVGTKQIKPNAVNGSKVADGSLTGADINASGLGKVPSSNHADLADSATNAAHATKAASADSATNANHATKADHATNADMAVEAQQAANADRANSAGSADFTNVALRAGEAALSENSLKLGGYEASTYQRTCQSGTIEGFAHVFGDRPSFPTTYSTSSNFVDTAFNCSGGVVEVKRVGVGDYRVHFAGLGAVLGFVNVDSGSNSGSGANDFANLAGLGGGEFQVDTRDGANGAAEDAYFYIFVM